MKCIDYWNNEYRPAFETFKSNTCHRVKDLGDEGFIIWVLESDEIRKLYNKHWYPEALYLLAMLDYLSRINDVSISTRYNDIRSHRLSKPTYPTGVIITSEVLETDEPFEKAKEESIPEFKRFNIIECDVRDVV